MEIKIGDKVYHREIYNGRELMEVVGLRRNQVELRGDFSGGTHNVIQDSWMPIDGVVHRCITECFFVPQKDSTSSTVCANCGKEKFLHTIGYGVKCTTVIINPPPKN